MAKVKKDSVSPKKRGRATGTNVGASTSKAVGTTNKRSSSKSKKATPRVEDRDIDSGISSPEKTLPRRTPTKKRSSANISKISKKSKLNISKTQTKKVTNITWLKGLLQEELQAEHKKQTTKSGIVVRAPSSLQYVVKENIEYVTYPWNDRKCSGYVKIDPGLQKEPKRTETTMIFLILMGKIHLLSGDRSTEYKPGTVITIPKGSKYGLKNKSKETCFIRFQSVCD